jgi:purine-nucleoside phosphorylase
MNQPLERPAGSGTGGSSSDLTARAEQAARFVLERVPGTSPRIGLVLGSGLGGLADRFEAAEAIPYSELPGFPEPAVVGHAGVLVLGTLAGVPAVAMRGRAHLYEGHPAREATFPIRVLVALGIQGLFLSNAAGAINPEFKPGDLMAIRDHINLMGQNPLVGNVVPGDPRFPDLSAAWDPELRQVLHEASQSTGATLREGVYAAVLGPSFETPAEIRMLERLGADAVGMSTVPELITARARGVRCFGVSCLTNYAAGISSQPLDHQEVIETTERVADQFQDLVMAAVAAADRRITAASSG